MMWGDTGGERSKVMWATPKSFRLGIKTSETKELFSEGFPTVKDLIYDSMVYASSDSEFWNEYVSSKIEGQSSRRYKWLDLWIIFMYLGKNTFDEEQEIYYLCTYKHRHFAPLCFVPAKILRFRRHMFVLLIEISKREIRCINDMMAWDL